jgi:hypothetical protein
VRSSVLRYDDPFAPVAEGEWEALLAVKAAVAGQLAGLDR